LLYNSKAGELSYDPPMLFMGTPPPMDETKIHVSYNRHIRSIVEVGGYQDYCHYK
jgi:hypothetical protein